MNINEETLGVSKQEFSEYFPNGVGYLKAVVDVVEILGLSGEDEQLRRGKGTVMIKVISSGKKIAAYPVQVTSEGTVEAKLSDDPVCEDNQSICYVAKNDIVSVKISGDSADQSDYYWTLDEKPIVCDNKISDDCVDSNGSSTNVTIFPIKGDPGTTYTLKMVAKDAQSKRNIELVKKFQVVKPYLEIAPNSEAIAKKVIGSYADLDGNTYDDLSNSVLEVEEGQDVNVKLAFHPGTYEQYSTVAWAVDGSVLKEVATSDEEYKDKEAFTLEFPNDAAVKPFGSKYSVEASATYLQPIEVRRALYKHWGINEYSTAENTLYADVQIQVIPGSSEALGMGATTKKMMASLVSNASGYVLFLVKIILSAGVILFTTGMVFSLAPEISSSNRKRYY